MAVTNGNMKWMIGLLIAIALGGGGWVFGAVQNTRVRSLEDAKVTAQTAFMSTTLNDKRIALLEASFTRMEKQNEQILGKLDRLTIALGEIAGSQ